MSTNQDEIFEAIESKIAELSKTDEQVRQLEVSKDREVTEITKRYAPQIDPLTAQRQELVNEIAELFIQNESWLTDNDRKTAVFRSGLLSSRTSPGSLEVEDEEAAIEKLRGMHKLKAFTRMGKRSLDKAKLKKHPEIIEKLPGVSLRVAEFLSIKIARTKIELKEELHPHRIRVK